jgi:hypothetical protein
MVIPKYAITPATHINVVNMVIRVIIILFNCRKIKNRIIAATRKEIGIKIDRS